MQTTSYSLGDLLRRAKGGTLTIPQFQRQFIWKLSQVKLLVDSMSRSYPIRSLLLLAKSSNLRLSSRHIEAEIAQDCLDKVENTIQKSETDEEYYILDGQQRTTSIARVFLNAHPEKCYYFDLKKMLKPDRVEETSEIDEKRDSWITEGTSWIIAQSDRKSPDRKNNNRLLRADIVLDQIKTDICVDEYYVESEDFPQYQKDRTAGRRAAAKIRGIFETIRNYKVPIVVVEPDSGIESICRIFETINSTGTKLTTFDLAVARFYPQPDLRELWRNTQEKYPILRDFEVDGERVLQLLYLVTATRSNQKYRDIEPTRSNLMSLTTESINEEWENASESLAKMYEFAKAQGARPETLPRHSLLVSLAAVRSLIFCEQGVDPWHKSENHDFIRRWYFSKVMQASRAQSSNYQVSQDFKVLLEYARTGQRPEIPTVSLDAEKLLTLRTSDVRYKSLQNIFAITLRQDLLSGNVINTESELHDHHIFPKNAGKKHLLNKTMLDSICNRVLMLSSSNQSLGEGYPQKYLKEIADRARKENMLGGLKRRIGDCLIPGDPEDPQWPDSFSINQFEKFCRKRAELIISRVRQIVGDSLQVSAASDDGLIEDDDD